MIELTPSKAVEIDRKYLDESLKQLDIYKRATQKAFFVPEDLLKGNKPTTTKDALKRRIV